MDKKKSRGRPRLSPPLGSVYGRLILIKLLDENDSIHKKARFACQCGNIVELRLTSVTSGNTKSCGCLLKGE